MPTNHTSPKIDAIIRPSAEVNDYARQHAFTGYKWATAVASYTTPTGRHVSGATISVALNLASHWNSTTGQCNPCQATIATELGIHTRTVQTAIAQLKAIGALVVADGTGTGHTSCQYRLLIPKSERVSHGELTAPDAAESPPLTRRTRRPNYEVNYEVNDERKAAATSRDDTGSSPSSSFEPAADDVAVARVFDWHARQVETTGTRPARTRAAIDGAARLIRYGTAVAGTVGCDCDEDCDCDWRRPLQALYDFASNHTGEYWPIRVTRLEWWANDWPQLIEAYRAAARKSVCSSCDIAVPPGRLRKGMCVGCYEVSENGVAV